MTCRCRAWLAFACLCLLTLVPQTVRAQLACTITTAAPMAFGSYNPLNTVAHDAQTSMTVRCTGSGVRLMRVRIGPGLAGSVGARVMQRNSVNLSYGLYINSGRTIAWGDGTDGTIANYRIVSPNSDTSLQMFGRIPARQNIPVGIYNDSVIVQIDW